MKYLVKKGLNHDVLYNSSALTIIGLISDDKNISAFYDWLKEISAITEDKPTFYKITGREMNETYGLTGKNAYRDDLGIVSVIDIDQMAVAIARFSIDGRWFDDIVDNNKSIEKEQNDETKI